MLQPYGITSSQYAIINLIMTLGEMTPIEIAKHLHVEKPTITQSTQKLYSKGFITMEPGKSDRREKWIRVTDEGEQLYLHISGQLQNLYNDLLTNVTKEDITAGLRVMDAIHDSLLS